MFKDKQDEKLLCETLRAYVEEYGPESVSVSVPKHWKEYSSGNLGRVALKFDSDNSIDIKVHYESIKLNFSKQLA